MALMIWTFQFMHIQLSNEKERKKPQKELESEKNTIITKIIMFKK